MREPPPTTQATTGDVARALDVPQERVQRPLNRAERRKLGALRREYTAADKRESE